MGFLIKNKMTDNGILAINSRNRPGLLLITYLENYKGMLLGDLLLPQDTLSEDLR